MDRESGKKNLPGIRFLIAYAVVAGFASFLLFTNLGDRLLWGDEAETANLAVNVTRYGIPKTFDGKNHLGLAIEGKDNPVWLWSPWLQEYLTAASFILFGVGTATARLPFVIVALAAVFLLVFLTYRLFLDHRMALLSGVFLICSDVFILHARQCRYYAVILLGQVLLLCSIHRLLTKHEKWGGLCLGGALALQFYSNYIIVGGNLLAMAVFFVFLIRRRPQAVKPFLLGLVVFILLAAPWLLYAHPWDQMKAAGRENIFYKMAWYLSEAHFHVVPVIFFLIPAVAYGMRRFIRGGPGRSANPAGEQSRGFEYFLWALIPAHLFFISLAPGIFLRYLLPLIPVSILLLISILDKYLKSRYLIYPIVAVLCLSNFVSVVSAYPFGKDHPLRLPLVNLIREVRTPYADRLKDVVHFLRQNGEPDQSILVFDPEFPLIFYTGMKIIDGRLLGGKFPKELPDWILSTSVSGVFADPVIEPPPDVAGSYHSILVDVHDSRRGGGIPEPDLHESFTNPGMTKMVIYRRK